MRSRVAASGSGPRSTPTFSRAWPGLAVELRQQVTVGWDMTYFRKYCAQFDAQVACERRHVEAHQKSEAAVVQLFSEGIFDKRRDWPVCQRWELALRGLAYLEETLRLHAARRPSPQNGLRIRLGEEPKGVRKKI